MNGARDCDESRCEFRPFELYDERRPLLLLSLPSEERSVSQFRRLGGRDEGEYEHRKRGTDDGDVDDDNVLMACRQGRSNSVDVNATLSMIFFFFFRQATTAVAERDRDLLFAGFQTFVALINS